VSQLRGRAGWDTAALISGRRKEVGDEAVRQELEDQIAKLIATVEKLEERATDIVPVDALLESARGLMLQQRWVEAARYFDEYVRRDDGNWEAYFARGVAHMNTRAGRVSDLAALRSYNEALALAPPDVDLNLIARLFTYRGAAKKRLGRLDEAAADLMLAQARATESYEVADNLYNLACVYAMMGQVDDALDAIERLASYGWLNTVRVHEHDYFQNLVDHPRFQALMSSRANR
jgi:tetratricopeptide (TPR) repeat protein